MMCLGGVADIVPEFEGLVPFGMTIEKEEERRREAISSVTSARTRGKEAP